MFKIKNDMKTITITGIMADFLDSIRAYEHESGKAIHFDERESSEFVNMYFNNGGKLKIEEEKPLFITEDGVDVYDIDSLVFIVKDDFKKSQRFALAFKQNKNDMKSFYHEANADEYIWRNKPVFSYNDIKKYQSGGEGVWYDIKTIAKRRSKE